MKFFCLQQDLIPALQSVARSCGVRSQLPVLNNILLQASHGELKLSATNLEIGVVKSIKVEISEEGEVSIPARTLVEVVANLRGEKLEFTSTADQLEVSTPTFSSKLNGISASEFPAIPLIGKEVVNIDPQVLLKSLPQVIFAAASDDGRPILTGILTEINNKKLQFVATDAYRLAHKIIPVSENINFKTLIPRKTFEEVVRLISEDDADQVQISLSEDKNQIIFKFSNTQISSRLIEGKFPVWEKIIPEKFLTRIIVDKSEILQAVKLASIFTRNEANIVTFENLSGKLILTSEAKELGSQKKNVEAQIEGDGIKITFNTKFLQDVFSVIATSQIIIELSGSLSAAVIKPVGEAGLQYIIMPVNQT